MLIRIYLKITLNSLAQVILHYIYLSNNNNGNYKDIKRLARNEYPCIQSNTWNKIIICTTRNQPLHDIQFYHYYQY